MYVLGAHVFMYVCLYICI